MDPGELRAEAKDLGRVVTHTRTTTGKPAAPNAQATVLVPTHSPIGNLAAVNRLRATQEDATQCLLVAFQSVPDGPGSPARSPVRYDTGVGTRSIAECQLLPNFALAAATQLLLESPARASHFSMATL